MLPNPTARLAALLLAVLLLVPACATGGGGSNDRRSSDRGNGGGLWQNLEDSRKAKERRLKASKAQREAIDAELAKGRAQVPAATRQKMERWWRQFVRNQPVWQRSRLEWHGMGKAAREILVENLLIIVVRGYESNQGLLYKRARAELFDIKHDAMPYLISGLSETYGDGVVRKHCIQLLSDFGREAVAPIRRAYGDADDRGRMGLLKAVSAMGEHGAPDSIGMLADAAQDSSDFKLQLVAIQGLGAAKSPQAVPVLLDSLKDDDLSIRKFTAASLSNYKQPRVVTALIAALAKAERAVAFSGREAEVVYNCRRSLRRITGKRWKASRDWSAWWKTQRR